MSYELASSAEDIGDGLWRWSVWVEAESLAPVDEVVYTLDPSFPKPVRRTKDRSSHFKIQDVASSLFTVYARANLADGSHVKLERNVQLGIVEASQDSVEQTDKKLKPLILAVDDDTSVLEAIVQDLRRYYAGSFRIVRAESGVAGLAQLRGAKALGIEAALLLADQRMPEMTGVDFLEKCRELYPNAKRALLSAYVDSEATLGAINRARVELYLNKPWDPPEERLYPALDKLLSTWKPRRRL
jgi:CheY-like chemotaxis protein